MVPKANHYLIFVVWLFFLIIVSYLEKKGTC